MKTNTRIIQRLQYICQRKRQAYSLFPSLLHADRKAIFWVQSRKILEFTPGSTCKMKRRIKPVEYESFMCQPVQRRSQCLIDQIPAEPFGRNKYYIIVFKHSRILIFSRRRYCLNILRKPFYILIRGFIDPFLQIQLQHIRRSINFRFRHLLCYFFILNRLLIFRIGKLFQTDIHITVTSENHMFTIQTKHRKKSQLLHLIIRIRIHSIELFRSKIAFPGIKINHSQRQKIKHHTTYHRNSGKSVQKQESFL